MLCFYQVLYCYRVGGTVQSLWGLYILFSYGIMIVDTKSKCRARCSPCARRCAVGSPDMADPRKGPVAIGSRENSGLLESPGKTAQGRSTHRITRRSSRACVGKGAKNAEGPTIQQRTQRLPARGGEVRSRKNTAVAPAVLAQLEQTRGCDTGIVSPLQYTTGASDLATRDSPSTAPGVSYPGCRSRTQNKVDTA